MARLKKGVRNLFRRKRFLTPFVLVCTGAVGAAVAEEIDPVVGIARLQSFLDEVETLRAQFRQSLLDADLVVVQESAGTLLIKRPGKFRWDYTAPYEQLILSDGTDLWIYDHDLEQATVRRVDQTLATTPAMLLSGTAQITDGFDVTGVDRSEGLLWIHLSPKVEDTDFRALSVGFEGRELRVMQLVDSLDQLTQIHFSSVVRNPDIGDELFAFAPPPGVDVIGAPAGQPVNDP